MGSGHFRGLHPALRPAQAGCCRLQFPVFVSQRLEGGVSPTQAVYLAQIQNCRMR